MITKVGEIKTRIPVKTLYKYDISISPTGKITYTPTKRTKKVSKPKEEVEEYQGISTKEGETLQNVKTGEILKKYTLTPQEEAKREFLIRSKIIKGDESPTEFYVSSKPSTKPRGFEKFIEEQKPYLLTQQEKEEIVQRKTEEIKEALSKKEEAERKRFQYVFDYPSDVLYYASKKIPEGKVKKFLSTKTPFSAREIYAFSFLSPALMTTTETTALAIQRGNIKPVSYAKAKINIVPKGDKRALVFAEGKIKTG